MSTGERGNPHAGPFVNLSQLYCSNLDHLAKSAEPLVRGAGHVNLETLGLFTRRARAWMDFPARLSNCKTPQDLLREQLQFWQTAAADYGESARRLAMAFGSLAPAGLNGAWNLKGAAPPRDYISVQEGRQPAEAPTHDRRAA